MAARCYCVIYYDTVFVLTHVMQLAVFIMYA